MIGRKSGRLLVQTGDSCAVSRLIAAGAEGEVHQAALIVCPKTPWFNFRAQDHDGLDFKVDVCLKIPHLDGLEALKATLAVGSLS